MSKLAKGDLSMPFDGIVENKALSKKQRLLAVATVFATYKPEQMFKAPLQIEFGPEWLMKRRSTKGTVLQPIVDGLNNLGIATKPTIGGVMESLHVDRGELHDMFCSCHHEMISAADASFFLNMEAELARD